MIFSHWYHQPSLGWTCRTPFWSGHKVGQPWRKSAKSKAWILLQVQTAVEKHISDALQKKQWQTTSAHCIWKKTHVLHATVRNLKPLRRFESHTISENIKYSLLGSVDIDIDIDIQIDIDIDIQIDIDVDHLAVSKLGFLSKVAGFHWRHLEIQWFLRRMQEFFLRRTQEFFWLTRKSSTHGCPEGQLASFDCITDCLAMMTRGGFRGARASPFVWSKNSFYSMLMI